MGIEPKDKSVWPAHKTKRCNQRLGPEIVLHEQARNISNSQAIFCSQDQEIKMLNASATCSPLALWSGFQS